jgi:hypothetical protein
MKTIRLPGPLRLQKRCFTLLLPLAVTAGLLGPTPGKAEFHLWNITEVYSSADGSVQFVKLQTTAGFQEFMQFGGSISSSDGTQTKTVNLTTQLPGDSANRSCLIGTANLSSIPGGVTPDYIMPPNFILPPVNGQPALVKYNPSGDTISYTDLPTDGEHSLQKPAGTTFVGTNMPVNFNGDANTIVPVKFSSSGTSGTNFIATFRTATGINGTAGPTYNVEYKTDFAAPSWTPLTSVGGDGTSKSVTNSLTSPPQGFFHLRVQ